jgi:predicted nucleic acid-binding protein
MSDKVFIDTNILIYAIELDGSESAKAVQARELVKRVQFMISTQVLGEFYRAVTGSRRLSPLSHDEAIAWIQLWKRNEVVSITVDHVDLALELTGRYRIAYFDALIVATAHMNACHILYSEDLNHGQTYGKVVVQNPFLKSPRDT